jgi:hypothetical protein
MYPITRIECVHTKTEKEYESVLKLVIENFENLKDAFEINWFPFKENSVICLKGSVIPVLNFEYVKKIENSIIYSYEEFIIDFEKLKPTKRQYWKFIEKMQQEMKTPELDIFKAEVWELFQKNKLIEFVVNDKCEDESYIAYQYRNRKLEIHFVDKHGIFVCIPNQIYPVLIFWKYIDIEETKKLVKGDEVKNEKISKYKRSERTNTYSK